jgi:hypothetical protein
MSMPRSRSSSDFVDFSVQAATQAGNVLGAPVEMASCAASARNSPPSSALRSVGERLALATR